MSETKHTPGPWHATPRFNGLTPAQEERLHLLVEECGEVIQAACKVLRHGWESCHPDGGPNNRALLERELGDLHAAEELMVCRADLNSDLIARAREDKHEKVEQYLHYN